MCITATMNKLRHRIYKGNDVLFNYVFFTPIDLDFKLGGVVFKKNCAERRVARTFLGYFVWKIQKFLKGGFPES
jgi:hypothetical protein